MQVQNTYTPLNFEGKVKFKRASLFDRKKLCSFGVEHKEFGHLNVATKRTHKGRYLITINNPTNTRLTKESFCMTNDDIYGVSIKTGEPYRRKHLGEITRLASIITMLKNGLKEINILSLNDAALFHSKYKFEPHITDRHSAVIILKNIASSNIPKFTDRVKVILEQLKKTDNTEELLKSANEIVSEFIEHIQKVEPRQKNHFQHWGLSMRLTRENVVQNKDFFNALFAKHDIDYKI
ncbi:hypothetical protein J6A64_06905 [bacterium]|nr:hypothetical protein [bacterium]